MSVECIDTNARPSGFALSWRVWLRAVDMERLLNAPRLWLERARARRELTELDTFILQDAGLSPVEVEREAAKPFWRG